MVPALNRKVDANRGRDCEVEQAGGSREDGEEERRKVSYSSIWYKKRVRWRRRGAEAVGKGDITMGGRRNSQAFGSFRGEWASKI